MEPALHEGDSRIAEAQVPPVEADAIVIGAGPIGLFQVFELGLLEIRAHVIDALPFAGGQPAELYPDKPIYDIPGIPVCTGRELVNNLLRQIEPFGATFHLGQEVTTVEQQDDGRFFVATSSGSLFLTKTLFIAAGVGAFQPRMLKFEGLEAFENKQLFHRARQPEDFAGRHVVIVGGADTALEWAATLATDGPHRAKSVTLIHRRDAFQAEPANIARMRALCESQDLTFIVAQPTGYECEGDRLTALKVTDPQAQTRSVPLDALLVFLGLSPKLGPIAAWGLDIERKQLVVDTEKFSTNVPGIFAVGDINTYPGKKKLIVSGFHEATLAAYAAASLVFPDRKVMLQYTTTSTQLHKVLGVASSAHD
ncbi:MAG: NAD(P)/FAD-dependent oxidoreductase [Hydrogenophaga sp.]|uniref:NAD(P)/FAD-dependent oxidoreductase n=1 Tax=Hydrogenophaga sp. TaxID=1904254 RepID=UPI00260E0B16|nr:NAD(P)/FAD-dependent oxidoreductase [Hydrogenophaga sp.]MDM7942989.1 NAD(P)/FAD-dependent oxidoreductase [Hydrogenophaga sp.]